MPTADDDESRILYGPGGLRIFVPYRKDRQPEDMRRGFPRYEPVLVWLGELEWSYYLAMEERRLPRDVHDYLLSELQLNWLESQRGLVESMRDDYTE